MLKKSSTDKVGWSDDVKELHFPGNIGCLIDRAAGLYPRRHGIGFAEELITFGEYFDRVCRMTNALSRLGIEKDDRIVLAAGNSLDYVFLSLAVFRLGAVLVPLNPMIRCHELAHILRETTPRLVVCDNLCIPHVLLACGQVPGLPMPQILATEPADGVGSTADLDLSTPLPDYTTVAPRDTAMIVYTAAMDGYPLGAELTHGGLFHDAKCCALDCFDPAHAGREVAMSLLSLFHLQGFTCGLLVPLVGGVPTFPLDTNHKTADSVALMESRRITHLISVPAVFASLVTPLASMPDVRNRLKAVISGGIAMPLELLETYESKLGVYLCEGYGLTECSPVVTWNRPGHIPKYGTTGTPLTCCEIQIADPSGRPLRAGEEGEVLVRGKNLFRGYFQQPDKTAAVFADGWFRTGDIGRLDGDNYLTLTGLKKDMINVFGLKVYPKEVERILLQHEDIASLRVYCDHHEKYGSLVGCDLKVKPGRQLAERDFRRWCRQHISAYKIPRRVTIHD